MYVRDIFHDLLRELGTGRVETAKDGVEAIEIMRAGAGSPTAIQIHFDLVISDLMMVPIDGLLLLKWIRESKDSPDRFMPFILMSGAADEDNVQRARDQGVSEILAKPFSAGSVAKRLLEVIDNPRQFVATPNYFGPDRQRQRKDFMGGNKRGTEQDDATIIYSADRVVRLKGSGKIYKFRLPNRLKELVGGAGGSGQGRLPGSVLGEADNVLGRKSAEFHDWALKYLATMSVLCKKALALPPQKRRFCFDKINHLAHELRGQGGTFGYPLITVVGKMLYQYTGFSCPVHDEAVNIVKAHIDTMRVVFRDKIKQDGGDIGRGLLEVLEKAVRQYSSDSPALENSEKPSKQVPNPGSEPATEPTTSGVRVPQPFS